MCAKPRRSPSISNNEKVTMSTDPQTPPLRPAGLAVLFGYSWLLIFLAIPAWIMIGLFIASTALALIWIGVALWGVMLVVLAYLTSSFRGIAQHIRSEEHTSELQSRGQLVCRLLLEKKNMCRQKDA